MDTHKYRHFGELDTGESIYYSPSDKSIAIEKDFYHLKIPTAKELEKIYKKFPNLKQGE